VQVGARVCSFVSLETDRSLLRWLCAAGREAPCPPLVKRSSWSSPSRIRSSPDGGAGNRTIRSLSGAGRSKGFRRDRDYPPELSIAPPLRTGHVIPGQACSSKQGRVTHTVPRTPISWDVMGSLILGVTMLLDYVSASPDHSQPDERTAPYRRSFGQPPPMGRQTGSIETPAFHPRPRPLLRSVDGHLSSSSSRTNRRSATLPLLHLMSP
jgi:hypothetical protein